MENKIDVLEMDSLKENDAAQRNNRRVSSKIRHCLRKNLMVELTLVGICLGFALGLAVRELKPSEDIIMWIGMPGTLYMRLLKMTILPLIACSVITGAASLDPKTNGKIGAMVVGLVILTHVISCSLSMGLISLVKPGAGTVSDPDKEVAKPMKTHDVFADLLRNMMPDNMVETAFRQTLTKYELKAKEGENGESKVTQSVNKSNHSNSYNTSRGINDTTVDVAEAAKEYIRVVSHTGGINVLGLITISAVFGVAAGKVRASVPHFLFFFENALVLVLIIVKWFFWLTPIGVLSLIAESLAAVDNVYDTFSDLGLMVATVVGGLLLHWLVVLPLLYGLVVRRNPMPYFTAMLSSASIAFAGTNSSVAMPEMFEMCEARFNMDKRVTRIAIPLCVTLNADGSAMFIVAASSFIAQYSGMQLDPDKTLVILILGIVSAMAIPGVPSASIFTILVILTAIRVPLQHVAILFAVEWLLDRVRTAVNVVSHLTIVGCVNSLSRKTLQRLDHMDSNEDNGDDAQHPTGVLNERL